VPICGACGRESPEGFGFCPSCGAPLVEPEPERRKLVTLLFCDVSGSTAMGERVDAESVRELMFRYFHSMRDAIERHGGTVEKFIGDAVMAAFGVPVSHEDDALRAVRAAAEMQHRVVDLNEELRRRVGTTIALRIGVHTGEVVAGDAALDRETFVTGDAVNTAARLEQAASPGEVLIGQPTLRLVRDAVEVEAIEPLSAKGKAEPLPAYRLIRVHALSPGRARRFGGVLVGRRSELTLLGDVLEDVANGACRLTSVVGEAGVGKSRLVQEIVREADALVLEGRCLAYGDGITYWALAEIVRAAAGIHDETTAEEAQRRVVRLVGDQNVASPLALALGIGEGTASPETIA
jgi:class 3 adenylate cyclase